MILPQIDLPLEIEDILINKLVSSLKHKEDYDKKGAIDAITEFIKSSESDQLIMDSLQLVFNYFEQGIGIVVNNLGLNVWNGNTEIWWAKNIYVNNGSQSADGTFLSSENKIYLSKSLFIDLCADILMEKLGQIDNDLKSFEFEIRLRSYISDQIQLSPTHYAFATAFEEAFHALQFQSDSATYITLENINRSHREGLDGYALIGYFTEEYPLLFHEFEAKAACLYALSNVLGYEVLDSAEQFKYQPYMQAAYSKYLCKE